MSVCVCMLSRRGGMRSGQVEDLFHMFPGEKESEAAPLHPIHSTPKSSLSEEKTEMQSICSTVLWNRSAARSSFLWTVRYGFQADVDLMETAEQVLVFWESAGSCCSLTRPLREGG